MPEKNSEKDTWKKFLKKKNPKKSLKNLNNTWKTLEKYLKIPENTWKVPQKYSESTGKYPESTGKIPNKMPEKKHLKMYLKKCLKTIHTYAKQIAIWMVSRSWYTPQSNFSIWGLVAGGKYHEQIPIQAQYRIKCNKNYFIAIEYPWNISSWPWAEFTILILHGAVPETNKQSLFSALANHNTTSYLELQISFLKNYACKCI